MPIPSSRTETTARPASTRAASVMWPPPSVYLAALLIRLANTWTMRVLSASTGSASFDKAIARVWPLSTIIGPAHLHRLQQKGRELDPLLDAARSSPG